MSLSDIFEKYTPVFYSDISTVSEALIKMMENNNSIVSFTYHKTFKKDLISDDDFVLVGERVWEYKYTIPRHIMDIVTNFKSSHPICLSYDDKRTPPDDVILFLCENINTVSVMFTFRDTIPETFSLDYNVYIVENYIRLIMRKNNYITNTCEYEKAKVIVF